MAQQAIELPRTDEGRPSAPRAVPSLGMRGGLGKTLLIAFLLLAIIPLSLLAILIYNRIQHDARQKLVTSLDNMVVLKEAHLVDWVEGYERDLRLLASSPELGANLSALIPSAPGAEDTLRALIILDRVTGDVLNAAGLEVADLQILRPLLVEGQRLVIVPEPGAGAWPLVAIGHTSGDRLLIGLLPWNELQQIVTASDDPEQGLVTYLATRDGLMISSGEPIQLPLEQQADAPEGLFHALQGGKGTGSYTNLDGVPVFGAYRWNEELGIALLAEQFQTEALATGNTLTAVVVGATLVVALITTVIAAVVTRRITRPIVQLTETAAWMARGDLRQRVAITRRDEIGVLARAFNRMAEELRLLYASLEAKVNERTGQLQDANERTSYYAMRLALSAEVARVATSIRNVDALLTTVTRLIREAFELDHVSIHLLGDDGKWMVWQANGDPVALREVNAGDSMALIERVASDGQRRVEQRSAQTRKATGLQPATSVLEPDQGLEEAAPQLADPVTCEMAVPLRVRQRLLGVLDLQSIRAGDFGDNDQMVYQSLADQISISIENARAYAAERETVERLRELDRIQSEFLTNMSHALRTPLNSVIGFSRVMLKELDGPLTDLQRTDLTTVYDSGRQLLGLINDMLELTHLELGTAPFSLVEVDLTEIIEGVMATTQALARSKPIQIYWHVPADLPVLYTDGSRVRQVILALLTNAVKYTDEGSIQLSVGMDDGEVTISVRDTGVGIPREERERLLSDTRYNGTDDDGIPADTPGFGLAISKRVVEKLGGKIWMQSEEGVGSTFTFTLPVRPPEGEPASGLDVESE